PAGRAGAPAAGGNPGADHGAVAAHPRPRPGTDRPGLLALGHRHQARPHRRAGRAVLCRTAAVHRPAAAVRPGTAALEPGRGGGPAALRRLAEPAPPGLNAQSAQRPPSQAKCSGTSTPAAAIHIGCGIMAMLITTITNTTKPTVSAAPRLCRVLIMAVFLPWKLPRASARRRGKTSTAPAGISDWPGGPVAPVAARPAAWRRRGCRPCGPGRRGRGR